MIKIKDIITIENEYPKVDELTMMHNDEVYSYINHYYCIGLANLLNNVSSYMIARYSLNENFDSSDTALLSDNNEKLIPYFENIKNLEKIEDDKWYHTNYGELCIDDVIIVGESEYNYYAIWFDGDVSDCVVYKISKTHYKNIEEFNLAIVEHFESELKYKIKPIRKPEGWFNW